MATYDIVCTVIGLILIVSVVVLCIINEKKDKARELVYKLLRQVMVYVDEAEKMFGSGKGEAKLDYVMTKVQLDIANYKIKISLPSIIDYIEQVLSTPSTQPANQPANQPASQPAKQPVSQPRPNQTMVNTGPNNPL